MTCANPMVQFMAPHFGRLPDPMMFPSAITGCVSLVTPTMMADPSTGTFYLVSQMPRAVSQPAQSMKASSSKKSAFVPPNRSNWKPQSASQRQQTQLASPPGSQSIEAEDDGGRGAISLLQEFVQCSKQFPSPQHRPILQWSFDTRMSDFASLEFRAQVAFLLDGVPHFIIGSWHMSKKLAQRDAAERCLGFFVGCWGSFLLTQNESDSRRFLHDILRIKDDVEALEEFCRTFPACEGQPVTWSLSHIGDQCSASAEVNLLGVTHKFAGSLCSDEMTAKSDLARRVLWYLQCPGYENCFEVDPSSSAVRAKEIPAPPANWAGQATDNDSLLAAERKTILMRVQNRLQQMFARQLKPGQSVWEWSYETDPNDKSWPPLCRANVSILAAGRTFQGPWVRGQREAQLETCKVVATHLDSGNDSSPSSSPTASVASALASSEASED